LRKINEEANKVLSGAAARSKNLERRLAKMSITIVVVFSVCNSFYMIYYILKSKAMLTTFDKQYLHSTARIFAIINSSVNVIIYGVFNSKFRETFCSLFCKQSAHNENPMSGIIVSKNSKDGLISNRTTKTDMTPLQTMN
jgi:hypothetical protein